MARRATSLGPKPSLFVFFLSFLCFSLNKPVFPLNRAFFGQFLVVSLCFSLAFFGLPLFQFLFLCLSLVLFFLSSFLSLFFAFFWFLVFVSFFPFLSSLLLFHERNTSRYSITCFFFVNPFSFLVSCLVFSFKSLFLIFDFSWF